MIHKFYIFLIIDIVYSSCDHVISNKNESYKVVRKNPKDSRCVNGIVLENNVGKEFCLSKDTKPAKPRVLLTCSQDDGK